MFDFQKQLSEGEDASSQSFAAKLDSIHGGDYFRDQFLFPSKMVNGEKVTCTYMCGNSLGLQPKSTRKYLLEELDVWANYGVEGHFNHPHNRPWADITSTCKKGLAAVVGAKESEVEGMGSLTSNLHFLLASFYKPDLKGRYKIIMEDHAFPSDQYAFASHVQWHGLDPADTIIKIKPLEGHATLTTEQILDTMKQNADKTALILFSGVQYYTGQLFDIPTITAEAKRLGIVAGWDLAHAAGNVELKLHDWNVDFAAWCTYKYINSGPGGIAGLFVHEDAKPAGQKLVGWWGHNSAERFKMPDEFDSMPGAAGYQISNPSVINYVALLGSLSVFDQTSMHKLRERSVDLTGYLEYLLKKRLGSFGSRIDIITPDDPKQRGAQISLHFNDPKDTDMAMEQFEKDGIICDDRKPSVIRLAPAPLYNNYSDIWLAVDSLHKVF